MKRLRVVKVTLGIINLIEVFMERYKSCDCRQMCSAWEIMGNYCDSGNLNLFTVLRLYKTGILLKENQ